MGSIAPTPPPLPLVSVTVGQTTVGLIDADITDLPVDAIVNSSNTALHLGGSNSIARAIVERTAGAIHAEVRSLGKLGLGEVGVTSGCGLPCRYIFHVATNGTPEQEAATGLDGVALRLRCIGEGVGAVLAEARTRSCRTLAVPFLATGTLRFDSFLAVETLVNVLVDELSGTKPGPMTVYLVAYGDELLLDLAAGFLASRVARSATEGGAQEQDWATAIEGAAEPAVAGASLGIWPAAFAFGGLVHGLYGSLRRGIKRRRSDRPEGGAATARLSDALRQARDHYFNLREEVRATREENQRLRAELALAHTQLKAVGDSPYPDFNTARLPLPAALAVRMAATEVDPMRRMENLRKGLETLVRYLAALALAEYNQAGCFDAALNEELRALFRSKVSAGGWCHISDRIARAYIGRETAFLAELCKSWHQDARRLAPLNGALRRLVELRNEIHGPGPTDETTARRWLDKAEPEWRRVVEHAGPLLRYRLLHLDGVVDTEGVEDPEAFRYSVKWLMGDASIPRGEIVEWRPRLKKDCLYLADPDKPRFLQISPFMTYHHCEITRARETFSIDSFKGDAVCFTTFRFTYTWTNQNMSPDELFTGAKNA